MAIPIISGAIEAAKVMSHNITLEYVLILALVAGLTISLYLVERKMGMFTKHRI